MYVYGACFYVCCSACVAVCGNVCCVAAVVKILFFFSLGMLNYVVCLCRGCDGCCVFCLYCEAWSCRCSCMGSVSVSSCRCCMFVSCVHPVAVLNAAFCMTCSLLMLVEEEIGDHTEEAYSRAGLITALSVAMSVSFCLPHPVAVSACTEMLWMCVLYVSFRSKVRPITFGCVAMGSALLFIVRSRLLIYSAGSGVNRVQVVLSGFSNMLFCFVQTKNLCRYGCMYFLAALVLVCVDVIVMSSA